MAGGLVERSQLCRAQVGVSLVAEFICLNVWLVGSLRYRPVTSGIATNNMLRDGSKERIEHGGRRGDRLRLRE